jgi:hypothetical protein
MQRHVTWRQSAGRQGWEETAMTWQPTYLLKARIVETQQPAATRKCPVNNRGTVFSAQTVPMAAHATMKCVMPPLNNNCTLTEEWCFQHGPC